MLKWIITLFRSWLGFRVEQQQHVGEIKQRNTDLKAEISELRKEDEAARDIPHGKAQIIEALKHGELS